MINGRALIGNLETALTHTEMHGVHVDLAWVWFIFCGASSVGFLVFKDGHLNVDFLTPAFSDRLDESRKSWMRVNG